MEKFVVKILLSVAALVGLANAGLFTADVVQLTSSNWKKEVLNSPHAWFINVCREG
jgi:hypothetical protein